MPTDQRVVQAAIRGFEAEKSDIDLQIRELRAMLSGHVIKEPVAPAESTVKTRKPFSEEAKQRMRRGVKAYWKRRKAKEAAAAEQQNGRRARKSA